jgi:hypothetical protein
MSSQSTIRITHEQRGAVTPEAYLDGVRSLLPALRQRVASAEQLRLLPDR